MLSCLALKNRSTQNF